MLSYFQSWAASKGIKLEPSTADDPQTNSQVEIVNIEITEVAKACNAERNLQLSKLEEIQLELNLHYDAFKRNNAFATLFGFDAKLGLYAFPYAINNNQAATERYNNTLQVLTSLKASEAEQANLY